MVRSNHHIALFFALNSSRGKWFDALFCRGNFAAGAKLSQPLAAGSQIVNSYFLSVWRLEL
ncbi:MAG TPA: hypothetical protein VJP83_03335, partial [Terriglobales bacterium]|nr:hypothetical protein [Terriglobales bacterium]